MIWEATFFARGPQEREIPRLTLFARDYDPGRIVVFLARANKAVRHSQRTRIRRPRSFAIVTYILSWWSTAASSQSAVSASPVLHPPEPQRYGLYSLVVDFRAVAPLFAIWRHVAARFVKSASTLIVFRCSPFDAKLYSMLTT
jgi:hypothetical protein